MRWRFLLGLFLWGVAVPTVAAPEQPEWYFDRPPERVLRFLESGLQPRTRQLYWRQWWLFLQHNGISSSQWERLSNQAKDYLVAD